MPEMKSFILKFDGNVFGELCLALLLTKRHTDPPLSQVPVRPDPAVKALQVPGSQVFLSPLSPKVCTN